MAGLVPAIPIPIGTGPEKRATDRGYGGCGDGRVKPGHDGVGIASGSIPSTPAFHHYSITALSRAFARTIARGGRRISNSSSNAGRVVQIIST
jgi:hypothetical protein